MTATLNPPAVVAVPHLSQVSRTIGPDVMIPMSWQGSSTTPLSFAGSIAIPPSNFAGSIGYSLHHVAYATEHERLGKIAYAASLAETILLEITAVHEGAGACKKRGVVIGVYDCHCLKYGGLLTLQFRTYARGRRASMLKLMPLDLSS